MNVEAKKMQFSHTKVDCFNNCPYKYKLQYIDKWKTLPDYEPQDALILGQAVHTGIQVDIKTAIHDYYMSYPIINDLHINEAIKLEAVVKKARYKLPLADAQFEVELSDEHFKGFIDMLVPDGDGYDIYDFKYSNNIDKYLKSPQLSIYKYYTEKLLNIKINHLYFVFVPKVMIRQKKTEDLVQFRNRLKETLKTVDVTIKEVTYQPEHIIDYVSSQVNILTCNDYIKNETRLCDWCNYQAYCQQKEDLDMLPSTSRVTIEQNGYKKIWIYGQPFSGKTTFADQSPTPLNLNTDGNVKYVTMPRVPIKDEVTVEGRLTKRKFAWEIFKETIDELEKGSDFETVVVDLLEDVYDYARVKVCDDNGWSHESDDSFKAYEITRNEFLRTIKRLINLPYNIILLSHEDTSIDIMKKGGDKVTAIRPNINEKVAKKVAGMVDLVARLVVDGNERTLNFKSDEVVFGGGRLKDIKFTEISLDWDALCEVYNETVVKAKTTHQKKVEQFVAEQIEEAEQPTPEVADEPVEEVAPARRTRRTRN